MIAFHHHLVELKLRFFYFFFSLICTFLVCYHYQIEIIYLIGKPFLEFHQKFIFLELTEAFYTLVKICTTFTILLLIPFFCYHIWSFFIPSFYQFERQKRTKFFFFFLFLLTIEIFFIYFLFLPQLCHFLLSYEMTSEIKNAPFHLQPLVSVEFNARLGSYVELLIKILNFFLIFFQIPLFFYFFFSKKLLYADTFFNNIKIFFFFSLLFSALIVPPDLISQLVVAFFIFLFFEFLIFLALFFE